MGGRKAGGGARPPVPTGFRERRVAAQFAEVLGVQPLLADDDFFALGGDPALAARLLDVVFEDSGVQLPADTLRDCPTVRSLADRIAATPATRSGTVIGYGTHLPGRPLFLLIPGFQARVMARSFTAASNRPFYVIQPSGLDGRARVDRSVKRRALRAIADIRSVQPKGPYLVGGYCADAWVAFEVVRRLLDQGERVELYAALDLWAPVFAPNLVRHLHHEKRWQEVCQWLPRRGRFFDARRRAALLRADMAAGLEGMGWRVRGRTLGRIQRPSTAQSRLSHEVTARVVTPYRPDPVDFDVVVLKAGDFGGWDWAVRRGGADMSWSRVTNGVVDVVGIPGNHATMLEGDNAWELGAVLARLVDRVEQ